MKNTEQIESQLFVSEEDAQRIEQERKWKQGISKNLNEDLEATDNELIKWYRIYRAFLLQQGKAIQANNSWSMLLFALPKLELDLSYTLDDYRSSISSDNTLNLYARKKTTARPSDRKFVEWEYYHNRFFLFNAQRRLEFNVSLLDDEEEYPGFDDPTDMPPMIQPHEVTTLQFDALAIWQAYLLRITNYFIGHRWHGIYHKMNMIFNPQKDFRPFMMPKEKRFDYIKQIEELNLCYEPSVIIDGNTAAIKHLALIGDSRVTECVCTVSYNQSKKKIESFTFEDKALFEFERSFMV